MAFTQNGSVWTGTEFKDIGTFVNQNNVAINALAGDDQGTLQSTTDSATGINAAFGLGDDRLFVSPSSSTNAAEFALIDSVVDMGDGNDIVFGDNAGTLTAERTPFFQGSTVRGGFGNDIIRMLGAINGKSTTLVNGNHGSDTVTIGNTFLAAGINNGVNGGDGRQFAVNPDRYDSARILGGQTNDFIYFELGNTNVVNTRINGNNDNDLISVRDDEWLTGDWQRSTINGGQGQDQILLYGRSAVNSVTSSLLVYGDLGNDTIQTGTGRDTVYGGTGADSILIRDGANLVYGDNNATDTTGGNDAITTQGAGQNTVYGAGGNDSISDGRGNSYLSGGAGADAITDGLGSDDVWAGTEADSVTLETTAADDLIQLDGESVAATAVSVQRDQAWANGVVITYANGVDVVTGFTPGSDKIATTIGDNGLLSTANAGLGGLYNAAGLRVGDGMVIDRSYYLRGAWDNAAKTFTVNTGGADSIVWTQGDNGPVTGNANAIVMVGRNAGTLTYDDVFTFNAADFPII